MTPIIVAIVAAIQLLMKIPALAQSAPKILLIAREPLKPGAEAEYDSIESETEVLAAKVGCPHPYLALQPFFGAKNEVWWLNAFDYQEELNSVGKAYKTNEAWNAALTKNQKRKEPLTGKAPRNWPISKRKRTHAVGGGASAICPRRNERGGASRQQQCL